MKRRIIAHSPTELAWINDNRASTPRNIAAFCEKFEREDVSVANYAALCTRNGWLTGLTGQYAPGTTPRTRARRCPYNANRARTQFKKGQLPHKTKFAGHERLHEDRYVCISINETNPHTG
jgi:hypothetical protein